MMVKKEFSREVVTAAMIPKVKDDIAKITLSLSAHSLETTNLIAKHASMVLHDGMTILVHSFSKSVIRVL
jgi:translation initiation factor 2B subunit (eIF-2B alpha/beta/delta family)